MHFLCLELRETEVSCNCHEIFQVFGPEISLLAAGSPANLNVTCSTIVVVVAAAVASCDRECLLFSQSYARIRFSINICPILMKFCTGV